MLLVGLHGSVLVGSWPAAHGEKFDRSICVVDVGLHGFDRVGLWPDAHAGNFERSIEVDVAWKDEWCEGRLATALAAK